MHELLKKYLIEERRGEIAANAEASMEQLRNGQLTSFADTDALMESLSHD